MAFAKASSLPSQSLSYGFFFPIHSHSWVITSTTTSPSLFFQPCFRYMSLLFSQICLFIPCLYLKYNSFKEELNVSYQHISIIIIPVIQAEKLASFLTCCSSSTPIILKFCWILNLFILLYTCCCDIGKISGTQVNYCNGFLCCFPVSSFFSLQSTLHAPVKKSSFNTVFIKYLYWFSFCLTFLKLSIWFSKHIICFNPIWLV